MKKIIMILVVATATIGSTFGQISGGNSATVPTEVQISESAITLQAGAEKQLSATVLPDSADQSVTWASSNDAVATVDATGKVIGVSEGVTAVVAVTSNDVSATCVVTVESVATGASSANFFDQFTPGQVTLNTIQSIQKLGYVGEYKDHKVLIDSLWKVSYKSGDYNKAFGKDGVVAANYLLIKNWPSPGAGEKVNVIFAFDDHDNVIKGFQEGGLHLEGDKISPKSVMSDDTDTEEMGSFVPTASQSFDF